LPPAGNMATAQALNLSVTAPATLFGSLVIRWRSATLDRVRSMCSSFRMPVLPVSTGDGKPSARAVLDGAGSGPRAGAGLCAGAPGTPAWTGGATVCHPESADEVPAAPSVGGGGGAAFRSGAPTGAAVPLATGTPGSTAPLRLGRRGVFSLRRPFAACFSAQLIQRAVLSPSWEHWLQIGLPHFKQSRTAGLPSCR